jgi:hypothetical protein
MLAACKAISVARLGGNVEISRFSRAWLVPAQRERRAVENLPSRALVQASRACLRPCTKRNRLAAQVKVGMPQLIQLTVFAPMYQMSSAQASWCLCVYKKSVACDGVALPLRPPAPTSPHPPPRSSLAPSRRGPSSFSPNRRGREALPRQRKWWWDQPASAGLSATAVAREGEGGCQSGAGCEEPRGGSWLEEARPWGRGVGVEAAVRGRATEGRERRAMEASRRGRRWICG